MTLTETVTYHGKKLEVEFTSYAGFPGSRTEPPEPAGIDIEVVYLIVPCHIAASSHRFDITEFLTGEDFECLEERLTEKATDDAIEREIDKADAAEDARRYCHSPKK